MTSSIDCIQKSCILGAISPQIDGGMGVIFLFGPPTGLDEIQIARQQVSEMAEKLQVIFRVYELYYGVHTVM